MTKEEKKCVEILYESNAISIIVEHIMNWQLNDSTYKSNMVVLFDTQYYNGYQNTHIDYTLSNIIQIVYEITIMSSSSNYTNTSATCL